MHRTVFAPFSSSAAGEEEQAHKRLINNNCAPDAAQYAADVQVCPLEWMALAPFLRKQGMSCAVLLMTPVQSFLATLGQAGIKQALGSRTRFSLKRLRSWVLAASDIWLGLCGMSLVGCSHQLFTDRLFKNRCVIQAWISVQTTASRCDRQLVSCLCRSAFSKSCELSDAQAASASLVT